MSNIPTNLKYTQEHEWIRVEGKTAIIGITDHAQKQLGDVVFVELPQVGQQLNAEDSAGTVESVKAVSEVYSPVTGKVVEVNQAVVDEPELLNEDPYGDGWLFKLELSDSKAADKLMDAAAYEKLTQEA